MKAMQTRLRARRAPFGLPAEGALGWGQEPTSEAKVHLHHAFFEHAGTPGAEPLIVFPPKQRLSQARRRRIVKANDFQCRNHYRIGITVLLHRHQEGSADIRPGNSIRQFRQKKMPIFELKDGETKEGVDLGNSDLNLVNTGTADAKVFIDYKARGYWSSAIKGNAGYPNPFVLSKGGGRRTVTRTELESETLLRIGVWGNGAKVKGEY